MILLECSSETVIKNLVVTKDDEVIQSVSSCNTPFVIDRLRPAKYQVKYTKNGVIKKRSFTLKKENNFFHDFEF